MYLYSLDLVQREVLADITGTPTEHFHYINIKFTKQVFDVTIIG